LNLFAVPDDDRSVNGPPDDVEAEWVARIARGDRAAFELLYRAYDRKLYGYISRMVGPDRAEDVLADVMVDVWHSAHRFGAHSRVAAWLLRIARNKAIDTLRKGKRRETLPLESLHIVASADAGPDREAVRAEERRLLFDALAKLPPDQREVVELTFAFGLSQREIATIAGCPVGTVKTRMFHARKTLRGLLDAGGITGAAS
jgi:RNA polymerase sigma-70 factor (ECF subfamily)